jgi:hypothetical protein
VPELNGEEREKGENRDERERERGYPTLFAHQEVVDSPLGMVKTTLIFLRSQCIQTQTTKATPLI